MALRPVEYLSSVFPGIARARCYALAREHPEWCVRVGRRVYIHEQRLEAWIDAGGAALPGGWRRDDHGAAERIRPA